jgi:Fe-S oxidoreductase
MCADVCPILPHTDICEISSEVIQEGVMDCITRGVPNHSAYTKAFACMECFKCTADICPEGLNPMLINEIIKGEYISSGLAKSVCNDNRQEDSAHKILASIQVSASEYRRITTPSDMREYRTVFFPGCNVYFQPEKILNALDIMDAIDNDYAFLPGLAHCCGDSHLFCGEIEAGSERADELIDAIAAFHPEAVVFWCPTCRCRFEKFFQPVTDFPFRVLSFPQYLDQNMNKLPLTRATSGVVTLHEACKSAYTGVDGDEIRRVLRQLPGVILKEMVHHGAEAACCGSGAISWFPDSCAKLRSARLNAAAKTGARRLVTVCHYCSQTFAAEAASYGLDVVNYVNIVADAMGIHRVDKFQQYARWGDLEPILNDVSERIKELPFETQRIIEILQSVFHQGKDEN